jgi:acyl-CoA reductase-like NAD-dependent aldehyde dehydrogenase
VGKIGLVMRFPVGVVAAITPFNAPVNMVMHKIGPAIAAGNACILKTSPKSPLCAHMAVECFVEAGGLPQGGLNALYGDRVGPIMVRDPRVDFVTFTGSTRVGRIVRDTVGMKRITLELGGIGPNIVAADADVAMAASSCARNGLLLAGQSCISVQNIYVHRPLVETFTERLLREARMLKFGNPLDEATDVGTLIDEAAAARVERMVQHAREQGAELLLGGTRRGALHEATVLGGVTEVMEIAREEIFGPAVSILPYDDIESVYSSISASPLGLQAGIFTASLTTARRAFMALRTGGVIVNGTSRWRSDQMPYGGIKDSGIGREGPKYAIRDMTDERVLVLN